MKSETPGQLEVKILTKMFEIVGAKYTKESTKKKNWYKKYTWDKEQEEEFKKFFVKECKRYFKLNKKAAEREYMWWNLNCGWARNDLN